MDSLPFHCEAYAGFGAIQGIARLDGQGLLLQYQTRDAVLGVLRSGMKSGLLPLDSLVSARYRSGFLWLMPHLELRVSDLSMLAEIPSSEGGRLKLRVAWTDRSDARKLAHLLGGRLAEQRLQHLQDELDRMGAKADPSSLSGEHAEGHPASRNARTPLRE
jgi:hypothetical protein